jgi:hypothetical protein
MKLTKIVTMVTLIISLSACATGTFDPPCACYNPQPANQNVNGDIYG